MLHLLGWFIPFLNGGRQVYNCSILHAPQRSVEGYLLPVLRILPRRYLYGSLPLPYCSLLFYNYPITGFLPDVRLPLISPRSRRSFSISLSSPSFKLRCRFASSVSVPCRWFRWQTPTFIELRFLAPCRWHVRHPKAAGFRQRCLVGTVRAKLVEASRATP